MSWPVKFRSLGSAISTGLQESYLARRGRESIASSTVGKGEIVSFVTGEITTWDRTANMIIKGDLDIRGKGRVGHLKKA